MIRRRPDTGHKFPDATVGAARATEAEHVPDLTAQKSLNETSPTRVSAAQILWGGRSRSYNDQLILAAAVAQLRQYPGPPAYEIIARLFGLKKATLRAQFRNCLGNLDAAHMERGTELIRQVIDGHPIDDVLKLCEKGEWQPSVTSDDVLTRSPQAKHQAQLAARIQALLQCAIDFIGNPEFDRSGAGKRIMGASDTYAEADEQSYTTWPADLPPHLARLCETQVLTADEERELFRRMNFLKYRANVLRARLDPDSPDEQAILSVERLLAAVKKVRDRIIKANMRLVVSIVKKFVTPKHSFDELLSDGIVSLMHAVDKFDFNRGFRFSTYAYRAVARSAYRTITDQHRRDARFDIGASNDLTNISEQDRTPPMGEQQWGQMRSLMQNLLDRLDRREQFILRSRFALGAHRKIRTFQCLADKLGISKERVRQLEQRAVGKLQAMAAKIDIDA